MADPVTIPTPVANGSLADAQNFVNTLPGNMTPEQRQAIARSNPDWHPPAAGGTPDFIPYTPKGDVATPAFVPPSKVKGLVSPGNIDLGNRPIIKNQDGTISSERSFSIGTDEGEVLIPRIFDGKDHTEVEAVEHYRKTGEHMGIFKTPEDADAYATAVHNRPIPRNDPDFIPFQQPQEEPPKSFDDPRVSQLGYYVNGDGNTVIAPKDGEEYSDTIKRAVEHYKKMSPQDREAAMGRETNDAVKKVIGTSGMAVGIGAGGAAALSSVYAPLEVHSLMSAGLKALTPALTAGVQAVGAWAVEHPVAAKAVYEVLKHGIGAAGGAGIALAARKVIDAAD